MRRYGFNQHVWDVFYETDKLESGRKVRLVSEGEHRRSSS
jgi:hypothetical protein